jgi:hypothetical protein
MREMELKATDEQNARIRTIIKDKQKEREIFNEWWPLKGKECQLHKGAEELCELAVELHHMAEGRDNMDLLINELADVELMLTQIKDNLPIDLEVLNFVKRQKMFELQKNLQIKKAES